MRSVSQVGDGGWLSILELGGEECGTGWGWWMVFHSWSWVVRSVSQVGDGGWFSILELGGEECVTGWGWWMTFHTGAGW